MIPQGKAAFLVPAFNPGPLLLDVVSELEKLKQVEGVTDVSTVVVDDGCTDGAIASLKGTGVTVLHHEENCGKGQALRTGLLWARDNGISTVVTLDADNQHPPQEAVRLLKHPASEDALVLAVRDLKAAGAPRPNQLSNGFSNWILSLFGGEQLLDTQCGLRRYPVERTLGLGATHSGYAYESEVVLRAARKGLPIVHVSCAVNYPEESQRVSHFDSVRDPAKNVLRVVWTTLVVPHHRATRRWARRLIVVILGALLFAVVR